MGGTVLHQLDISAGCEGGWGCMHRTRERDVRTQTRQVLLLSVELTGAAVICYIRSQLWQSTVHKLTRQTD